MGYEHPDTCIVCQKPAAHLARVFYDMPAPGGMVKREGSEIFGLCESHADGFVPTAALVLVKSDAAREAAKHRQFSG